MSNKKQLEYNQAIDNLTYLVLNYPKPVQELLAKNNVFFQGKPSKKQLINEVIEQLKDGSPVFSRGLENLIQQFYEQENDAFWGAIAKGAVGILGGLFGKKKRRRRQASNNAAAQAQAQAQARAAAQAATAKRDMEMRMRRMREEQERKRREADERRRKEEERRREAAERKRKEDEAKKKSNMMLMIGGGVVVLGIGAVVLMKSSRPSAPYGQSPMQTPR